MVYLPVIWIGKVLQLLTRLRGGGSALPGLVVERLAAGFLARYTQDIEEIVLVAGTNGKTTTTKMLRQILDDDGRRVLSNAAGSNMPRGIISALLRHMDWWGRVDADVGLFEVDEAFLGEVAAATRPRVITVLNLLRDQLDRYGELDRTARLVGEALPMAESAVLNADDPRVAQLAQYPETAFAFGAVEEVRAQLPHDDALYGDLPTDTDYDLVPTVQLTSTEATATGQAVEFYANEAHHRATLQIAGVFNAYNAAAALAVARVLDVKPEQAVASLERVAPAFGRSERVTIEDKSLLLLLVKNPGGFNQIIHTYLARDEAPVLMAVNDNYADGRDVSWLWDVDIERLCGSEHRFFTTGTRGFDMALRLEYADLTATADTDVTTTLERVLEATAPGQTAYLVMTYTAMLELRKELQRRTHMEEIEV